MKLCPKDLVLMFEDSDLDYESGEYDIKNSLSLDHANKLLRDEMMKWPVVYGDGGQFEWFKTRQTTEGMFIVPGDFKESQYQSRILPAQWLEPIKQETAEDVLRDLVKGYEYHILGILPPDDMRGEKLVERARKVLGK